MSVALAGHWDDIYTRRRLDRLSWYEPVPRLSLRLLTDAVPAGHVVDVGAGASGLAANLITRGYQVTLVDVSAAVLDADRASLRDSANYVASDVLTWEPETQFDGWHDRAFFHFLTVAADQRRYVDLATRAIRPGGALVMGIFAADGPSLCSNLPTQGHDADELTSMFAEGFALEQAQREEHHTPHGAVQPFTWVVLRRREQT